MARNGRDLAKVMSTLLQVKDLSDAVRYRLEALLVESRSLVPGSDRCRIMWKVLAYTLATYVGEPGEVEWKQRVKEIFTGYINQTEDVPSENDLP